MPAIKPTRGLLLNKSHPFARGLVGFWLLNEGSGNTVQDLSGNGFTGIFVADTHWVHGKFGSCLSFDGTGDYVDISGYNGVSGNQNRTILMWINTSVTATVMRILSYGTNASGEKWAVRIDQANNDAFRTEHGGGYITGSTQLTDGNWHQIVSVLDGTTLSGVTLYVDGQQETVGASANLDVAINTGTTNNVRIGVGVGEIHPFTGLIDSPMIWNRAISASEIALLYREPYCMFRRRTQPQLCFVEVVEPEVVARTRSHVGFRPIEGAERLRGLRRNALY